MSTEHRGSQTAQTTNAAALLYRVGIDGGGSGTRARLTDADGRILGEGHSGASGLAQGIEQAWRHIGAAIAAAVQVAELPGLPAPQPANTALALGLAGANSRPLHQQFLHHNPGYPVLRLESDALTALLGAHGGGAGAMLAVGTGSVGLARLADGRCRSVGGWGFPSGDEGSGAWLGLHAANLAQQLCDGRLPPAALAEAVLQHCGQQREALLEWCCQAGQAEFASLAPLVFACAEHDPLAEALLARAVHCMEQLLLALDPAAALPLALLGSVGQRLAPRLPAPLRARLVRPRGDAMDGALSLFSL